MNLLKDKGILSFIIPNSLKSSPSFSKIRSIIYDYYDILYVKNVDKFSNGVQNVSQDVMIFICQKNLKSKEKCKDNEKNKQFIIELSPNNYIIHEEEHSINKSENTIKIKDLNCEVKTGSIVWNQHKEKLCSQKTDTNLILIYSDNIKERNIKEKTDYNNFIFVERSHDTKKQYINIDQSPITPPFLAISRTCGSGNNAKIKLLLIKEGNYLAENHINIITGELDILERIYTLLVKKETIEYLKKIIGTANLSKTQLENLFIDY